ncbi:ribonuclease H-like domain-containing protein [Kockovaella imperatae]|uniref:Ribonuclease H-like domain-containing protein n=1 Tax=Kockovaella imperatae TaxID=4999 RepID=A0A1Y1U9N6_9TREE|nr:ribonuclease H-like domain-containing protein [Kockovaella imperatae]ORX34217.1 ribonuclease H-like domain-containing protein [Kockovaella imperatae]
MRRLTDLLDVATTHANALPPKSDLSFHRTLHRKFAKDQDEASSRILKLADSLLAKVQTDISSKGKARRKIEDEEDVVDGYRRGVMDVVNGLLEDAASRLDEVSGQKKSPAIQVSSSASPSHARIPPLVAFWTFKAVKAHVSKPQLQFPDRQKYDSYRHNPPCPFRPHLLTKPHALVPLEFEGSSRADDTDNEKGHHLVRQHPYRYETEHIGYPTAMFMSAPPIPPRPIDEDDAILVETPEAYRAMVAELVKAKEIAVDTEHHDVRSYFGFTCLMQISTREKDWIVDVIKLRGLISEDKFGGVMVDPSVVKVLQGADQDIVWLQKDFQIYIVNLFDTHQAAAFLQYPQRSLKALVAKFCGITLDKGQQMADWRVRPLTPEMIKYARADTHYLLYVYDKIRNELLEKSRQPTPVEEVSGEAAEPVNPQGSMRQVLGRSEEIALKLYQPEESDYSTGDGAFGWYHAVKMAFGYKGVQTETAVLFKHLHVWRDMVARREDESPHYIMSNDFMRYLAQTAATNSDSQMAEVMAVVPREYADDISKAIFDARTDWEKHGPDAIKILVKSTKRPKAGSKLPDAMTRASPTSVTLPPPFTTASAEPSDSDMWGTTQPNQTPIESSSDLFGTTVQVERSATNSTAAQEASDLFGPTLASDNSRKRRKSPSPTFVDVQAAVKEDILSEEVVNRALLPSQQDEAQPAADPKHEVDTFSSAAQSSLGTGHKTDDPAPARIDGSASQKPDSEIEDNEDVVKVSRNMRKKSKKIERAKRKQEKKARGMNNEDPPKEIKDFDYASAPSLLDAAPAEVKGKAKKSKARGTEIITPRFGTVAKDLSEPKGGNKSKTFH